jgi:cell division protein FtsW
LCYPILAVSVLLFLMTRFTPFASSGGFAEVAQIGSLLPCTSEFAKIAIILFYAVYHQKDRSSESVCGGSACRRCKSGHQRLDFRQRDYSSALLFLGLSFALLLASGSSFPICLFCLPSSQPPPWSPCSVKAIG